MEGRARCRDRAPDVGREYRGLCGSFMGKLRYDPLACSDRQQSFSPLDTQMDGPIATLAAPPNATPMKAQAPPARATLVVSCMVLAGLAALISVTRLHTYNEPLDRDITCYAVIGHEILAGRPLYSELWDHKPPAIHVTYALADLLWGYGPRTIYLLGVTMAILTLIGVYVAGVAPPWGRAAGLWAAAFWAVTSGSLRLQANQPNSEVFINACLAGAFALLVRGAGRPMGWVRTLLIGLLFALASLYKQVAVTMPMFLALAHVACPPDGPAGRRRALAQVAIMAGIGAAAWGLIFAYFWATGHFQDFYDAVFTYNRFYSTAPNSNFGGSYYNITALPRMIFGGVLKAKPLLLLTGAGFVAASWQFLKRLDRSWLFLAAYAVGTHLAVQLPGWAHPHYFQLWLPVLAIGGAWGAAAIARAVRLPGWMGGNPARFQHLLGLLVWIYLALLEAPNYALSADEWSNRKFGAIFIETKKLGEEIDKLLLPNEGFYEWGDNTGLYFASRRRPIAGLTYFYPLLDGPLVGTLTKRVLADLEATPPELLIILHQAKRPSAPFDAWWSSRYRPFPGDPHREPFELRVRRGGALEARLEARGAFRSRRTKNNVGGFLLYFPKLHLCWGKPNI